MVKKKRCITANEKDRKRRKLDAKRSGIAKFNKSRYTTKKWSVCVV